MLSKEVQELIYNTLSASPALAGIPIDKFYKDYDGALSIVYQQISYVPHAHADNAEQYSRLTFQLSVIRSVEDELDPIYTEIEKIMVKELGFEVVSREELCERTDESTMYYMIGRFTRAYPVDYKFSK